MSPTAAVHGIQRAAVFSRGEEEGQGIYKIEREARTGMVSGPSVVAEGGMVVVPPPFTCNMA